MASGLTKSSSSAAESSSGKAKSKIHDKGDGWEIYGGYMAAKKQKLDDQFRGMQNSSEELASNIFKGVVIHVNGYTKPSSDELKRLIRLHGGHYAQYLSKRKVTHIIATNLTNSKIAKDLKHCKVVKPEWITESVKAGRQLSYIPYLLYTAQTRIQQGLSSFSSYSVSRQTSVVQPDHTVSIPQDVGFPPDFDDGSDNLTDEERSNNGDFEEKVEKIEKQTVLDQRVLDTHSPNKENSYNNTQFVRNAEMTGDHCPVTKVANNSIAHVNHMNTKVSNSSVTQMNHVNTQSAKEAVSKSHNSSVSKSPAKAGDPQYLSEFYNNSRLHHLSTWKSEWRAYVTKLQNQGSDFSGRKTLSEKVQQRSSDVSDRGMDIGQSSVKRPGKPQRVIMHVDMDCFFVSVGLRIRPHLKGKPIAVTHSRGQGMKNPTTEYYEYERKQWEKKRREQGGKKGRQPGHQQGKGTDTVMDEEEDEELNADSPETSITFQKSTTASETFHSMAEIASCSYEARQAGVKNGMFMGPAKKLCPELQTIPYDFEGYQEVSKILYDTVASYTHDIEAVSCDEMLVDCTDLLAVTGATPLEFATVLRQEISDKTGCTASAGMGPNILLAKMATRKAKPNGEFYLTADDAFTFLTDQSVQNIPGVGWSMSKKLKSMNVTTCGQLQMVPMATLQKEFGPKTGQSLYKYCRGQDDRPIKTDQERKSVSAEINYGIRFQNEVEAEKFLYELSEEVHNRLKNIGMKGKSVTLKVMIRRGDAPKETAKFMGHGICNNISKSAMLPLATDDPNLIYKECSTILRDIRARASDLRGVGIQVQRLEPAEVGLQGRKKGAQTILNFAIPKSATPSKGAETTKSHTKTAHVSNAKSPTENNRKWTGNTAETEGSEITPAHTNSTQVSNGKSSTESNRHWMDSLRDFDTDLICTGDQNHTQNSSHKMKINSAPSKNLSGKVQEHSTEEGHSESEESPEFLQGAVCHNLLDELSRKKTARRFLPPLPTLDMSSPVTNDADLNVVQEAAEPEPSQSLSVDYFPSPSQIDPHVLEELPQEIRLQIKSEMNNRKNKNRTTSNRHEDDTQRPGCSHWSDPNPSEDDEIQSKTYPDQSSGRPIRSASQVARQHFAEFSNDDIVALPSPSQLDESCLNALPEDIQREILEAYNQQKPVPPALKQAKSPAKGGKSPRKFKSPGKSKRNSPHFKIPRGRPGRGRPKKLDFQRKQPKIDTTLYGKTERTPSFSENESHDIPDLLPDINHKPQSGNQADDSCSGSERCDPIKRLSDSGIRGVNLCGAVTLPEIKSLLSEWLESSPVPEIEDERVMITYLQELIIDHNLEQVDLVIKFLHRKVKQFNSRNWLMSFGRIVKEVQNTMKTFYGSTLKMCTL